MRTHAPTGPLLIENGLAPRHWGALYEVIVKPLLGGENVPDMHKRLDAGVVPVVAAHAAKGVLGDQGTVAGLAGI